MKKIVAILLLITTGMLILTGCRKEVEVSEPDPQPVDEVEEKEETYTFGFSCITMEDPYFIALEASLREAAQKEGHQFLTVDAGSDAARQEKQIKELIEQGIDAIFLCPVDWMEITPAIDLLNEAGVKIINIDTEVQAMDKVDAYVGSDNTNAGYLCGMDLLERIPEGGKIILVECPNRNSINNRIQGFEKAIAKKGFEVVARIDAKGDLETALTEVEAVLRTEPDVVAIMCGNDPTALGALVAANSLDRRDLVIYGIDGSPEVKKEIAKEGSLVAATVGQSPSEIGKEAVSVALSVLKDEKYESVTYIDTFWIDKENVVEYGLDTWQ